MGKYIIETKHSKHQGHFLREEHVNSALERIQKAIGDGRLIGAYSKVGGGSIWIVESENNNTLYRRLRELHVDDVTVTPVVPVTEVLTAYSQIHAAKRAASDPKAE